MLVSASCVAQAGCAAPRRIAMPPRSRPAVLARPQRRSMAVRAADELDLVASSDPEDARGSIAIGLKYSAAGQWEQAQQYFERALELPGTGLKRWRDKPPALSAGELQAALYNVACCRSRLGDVENGLIAIAGAVEQGYADFEQLRSDPDLAALRADERWAGLVRRFEPRASDKKGFLGLF